MLTMPVRQLGETERSAVMRVLDSDPFATAQVAERIAAHGLSWWRSDGRIYGYGARRHLESLLWSGAHLTPILATPPAVEAFAELIAGEHRICSSIVGRADAVLGLWDHLAGTWGHPREVRPNQPILATGELPPVRPDPAVRLAENAEIDLVFPAAVAMYTEEVGVSPLADGGGSGYKRRVAELVRSRRTYVRIENRQVVFKAELAVVTSHTAQVQGVWVNPAWRGLGIAAPAMAAVVTDALRRVAPTVSLYVNDYNHAARRVYARCGFRSAGTFATILF
ncbi:putative GNAT family acetyltransferase [Catenuloplanes nepalensis]|uniref:GNAT family acetyltransferase n=1 Tax=Catenuloplanes nepalensis TaxID=587533 RepID=A0ABT9N087_9ACTN|nr:GNAT family N-acetyltransferase [Catenuloplanes nepalensis]MDP9797107.1 putative GNAT family acetyltransferase [Catenuloplanes nepalensis]